MIIFAGDDVCGTNFNDVWVLENANGNGGTPTWMQLSPLGGPPPVPRDDSPAVYDPVANRMTIFGGNPSPTFNDAWVLENANGLGGTPTWVQLSPLGLLPLARSANSAVFDSTNNRMTIFGGSTNIPPGIVNDVWVLSNANGIGGTPTWTQLSPTGGPPVPRRQHSAVYNPSSDVMTIFGGGTNVPTCCSALNDTWVLTDANGIITVAIDIKPGEDPPSINPKSHGKIPVAILSSSTFDVTTQVDRTSLTFGHTGDEQSLAFCNLHGRDVNGDGLLDLVCHFYTQKTRFKTGDTVGVLKGKTVTGAPIRGTDSIRIVPGDNDNDNNN
jgi:hypothetical protein